VAVVALLGVGTLRAAGWLFVLCVLAAAGCAALAVAGGRTPAGIAAATLRDSPDDWRSFNLARMRVGQIIDARPSTCT
jgi:hypothetical protein